VTLETSSYFFSTIGDARMKSYRLVRARAFRRAVWHTLGTLRDHEAQQAATLSSHSAASFPYEANPTRPTIMLWALSQC
jgi:hypothetical protein